MNGKEYAFATELQGKIKIRSGEQVRVVAEFIGTFVYHQGDVLLLQKDEDPSYALTLNEKTILAVDSINPYGNQAIKGMLEKARKVSSALSNLQQLIMPDDANTKESPIASPSQPNSSLAEPQSENIQNVLQQTVEQTDQLRGAIEENKKLKEDIANRDKDILALLDKNAEREEVLHAKNIELAKKNADFADLSKLTKDLTKKNADLKDENADLSKLTKDLIKKNADLKDENADLSKLTKDLIKKNADLKDENADLNKLTKDLIKKNADLKDEYADLSKKNKELTKTNTQLEKKLEQQKQKQSQNSSPVQQRSVVVHYNVSPQFPMIDDVESCLTQAQQNTFYQFKHVSKDSSPCNLLLYFDIVDDRIRTVEAKRDFARSLLAKTRNNCVWVFVCFKPTNNEEGTKITNSIKGLASGLTLPNGQFAQVYLTAEYQVKSNQRDQHGNFLHFIVNKEDFKQKVLSLVNMKVTGVQANLPGISFTSLPVSNGVPTPFTMADILAAGTADKPTLSNTNSVYEGGRVDNPPQQQSTSTPTQIAPPVLATSPPVLRKNVFVDGTLVDFRFPDGSLVHARLNEVAYESSGSVTNDQRAAQFVATAQLSSDQSSSFPQAGNQPSSDAVAQPTKLDDVNPLSILQKYTTSSMQDNSHLPTEDIDIKSISVTDNYPRSLQDLTKQVTSKLTVPLPSNIVIQAKTMEEDWVVIDTDDKLKELPLMIPLPTIEFRALIVPGAE